MLARRRRRRRKNKQTLVVLLVSAGGAPYLAILKSPSINDKFNKFSFNVGSPSATLAQH